MLDLNVADLNWWIVFGIVSRLASIVILSVFVIPIQWRELNRQYKNRKTSGDGYWKLALELLVIVLITVACAIVPITYQGTRIFTSDDSLNLQNAAVFFTNLGILVQSIGWFRIYTTRYDNRR
jgi:membrane protein YdbS with pleckstrin-like domain